MLNSHVQETEQIATAIEEMDATANSMASDAANTAKLTDDANQTSAESKKIVAKSQKAVKALIADVEQAAKYVQEMNTHTTGISTVLNVIGKIAEQTNLLALNAAIEAARAGEQGRGFAVVADEVRELANRTKDSTAEIEQAIENLLSGSQQVVNSMDETKKRCQETAVESDAVANSLDSLIVFINHINDLSGQIATAAEEQSCVTKEVSHNMNTISGIVSELKNVGLASSANAADIEKVNGQLVTIVNKFKL
ncbi:methyl-accepting chemotaxis protein [Shewanella sp.]|jgi:methyl-accepting chemotaxis protein